MFLWIFFFISLFCLVDQSLYCFFDRRCWDRREQQLGMGLLCSLINGIAAFSIQDGGYHSFVDTASALFLIFVSTSVCCRFSFQFSIEPLIFAKKFRRMVLLLKLDREHRLMILPCPQGRTVYWIDQQASPPRLREMKLVAKIRQQYVGIFEDASCLVFVDQIYLDEKEAHETLCRLRWKLYTGV